MMRAAQHDDEDGRGFAPPLIIGCSAGQSHSQRALKFRVLGVPLWVYDHEIGSRSARALPNLDNPRDVVRCWSRSVVVASGPLNRMAVVIALRSELGALPSIALLPDVGGGSNINVHLGIFGARLAFESPSQRNGRTTLQSSPSSEVSRILLSSVEIRDDYIVGRRSTLRGDSNCLTIRSYPAITTKSRGGVKGSPMTAVDRLIPGHNGTHRRSFGKHRRGMSEDAKQDDVSEGSIHSGVTTRGPTYLQGMGTIAR
jgi:hypothetical protein